MRFQRYLAVVGCAVLLGATASIARAAPTEQTPAPWAYGTTEAGLLAAVQQVVPPQLLQQTPLQLMALDNNTYVVSHPNLFWPTNQMGIAEATAQQLASLTPGWSTTVTNGPQGYGVYLSYQPVTYGTAQAGLLPAIQQIVPPQLLQQTPLQLMPIDNNAYIVSHPNLFWSVNQAAAAQAQAQQLASLTPGWSTSVTNGPQGYGAYLTYQPVAAGAAQAGLLSAVQQVLPTQLLQQTPLQLMPLDNNTYVVSHPNLFWPMDQMGIAEAQAQQMASVAPGWSTNVTNGPQGYGVYLTYQPVTYGTAQTGLLGAIQQVVPPQVLQQTPLQLVSLDNNMYAVSHPNLFWSVNQAAAAQAQAQRLASFAPGWSTTVMNGPQGYGVYLTYQSLA
jgi:hypothetical protein